MAQFDASTNYTNLLNQQFPAYGQVSFPASQVASSDPNTLDDYEEGTWTPSLGGTTTYTTQTGRYTKIGRLVDHTGQIQVNAIGSGSTGTISGLPFTAGAIAPVTVGYFASSATSYTYVGGFVTSGTTAITTAAIAAAGASMTQPAVLFQNGTNVVFGCSVTV